MSESPGYRHHVLRWMREVRGFQVDEITGVTPHGTDWAGSTEGGFYDTFSVSISYTSHEQTHFMDVTGEDMGSLWNFVVGQLPADEIAPAEGANGPEGATADLGDPSGPTTRVVDR